ncbi:unnamed protein product [Arabis nemorensis]|uniref:Uncharacterized protein n=1 Tax=Arabis nemorensis TaxID=586526 RepID=A0A565BXB2_9BRAS|nr:unnamed protein product [Arabis nemorensis]
MTRQRARTLQHKYNQSMRQAIIQADQEMTKEEHYELELQDGPVHYLQVLTRTSMDHEEPTNEPSLKVQDIWPLLSRQAQANVLIISCEEQGS